MNPSHYASVAQRFSWASKRVTTREEDIAYCLLGLLGVNMPLLYGEGGTKAFERLQLELINQSADETIFAWGIPSEHSDIKPLTFGSCLARHPMDFKNAAMIDAVQPRADDNGVQRPYFVTNRGISITAEAIELKWKICKDVERDPKIQNVVRALCDSQTYLLVLRCANRSIKHFTCFNAPRSIAVAIKDGISSRMMGRHFDPNAKDPLYEWELGEREEEKEFMLDIGRNVALRKVGKAFHNDQAIAHFYPSSEGDFGLWTRGSWTK